MNEPMLFNNQQIDTADLPSYRQVRFVPLEKKYHYVLWIYRSIFFGTLFVGAFILAFFIRSSMLTFLLPPVAVFILYIISLIVTKIAFNYKGYAVRERDIVYRTGWLNSRVTTVPFNRVQHADIRQNLLERTFDLSTLNIYTAGGQASDLSIPGLLPATAEKLKAFTLQTVAGDEEE